MVSSSSLILRLKIENLLWILHVYVYDNSYDCFKYYGTDNTNAKTIK